MALFDIFKKQKKAAGPTTLPDDHTLHKEAYKTIGMQYHQDSFARISTADPDWRKSKKAILETYPDVRKIYHYSYVNKPVDLRVDPTDQFGKDRIMVFIAGQHVGYLPEANSLHVGEILRYCSVKYITAKITGGDYRIVFRDGEEHKGTDPLEVSLHIGYSVK